MSSSQRRSRSFDKGLDDHHTRHSRRILVEVPDRKNVKKTGSVDENQLMKCDRNSRNDLRNVDDREVIHVREFDDKIKGKESDEEEYLREYVFSKRGIEPQEATRVKENGDLRRTKDARDSRRLKERSSGKRDKEKRKTYPSEDKSGSRRTRTPRRSRKPSPVRSSTNKSWTCYDENNDSIAHIVYERLVSIGRGSWSVLKLYLLMVTNLFQE